MALPEESWAGSYCCDYYPARGKACVGRINTRLWLFPAVPGVLAPAEGAPAARRSHRVPPALGRPAENPQKQRRDFKVHKQRVVSLLFLETAGLFCWNISKKSHSVKGKSPDTVWKSDICVCPAWCAALGVGQGVKFSFLTPAWWLIPAFLLQKLWCSYQFNQIYPRTLFKVLAEV